MLIGAIYDFYENGDFIASGTVRELMEKTGYSNVLFYRILQDEFFVGMKHKIKRKLVFKGYDEPVYEIFKQDGTVVFTGIKSDCCNYLNTTAEHFKSRVYRTKKGNYKFSSYHGKEVLLARRKI